MIKATMIYGVASMLPSLLGFVLLPLYSRHLTTSEFGVVAAMGVLSSVIAAFSTLSLDRAATRFYFDSTDLVTKKKALGTFFLGSMGFALFTFFILILSKPLLGMAFPEVAFYPYYFLTIVTVTAGVCGNFVLSYFRVAEKPRSFLAMIGLTVLLQLGLIYFYVVVRNEGALGQVTALLISTLVLLPVYLVIAYRQFIFVFDWDLIKRGVTFSWPLIPTLLVAWVLNWSDSIFIANYCSMNDVGIYSMGYKISMVILMVSGAFSTAFYPVFFRKANEKDQVAARQSIYSIIHVASRGFIVLGFLLALFAEDVVRLLLDEKYHDSYLVIRIILMSHILSAIMGISSNLYYQQTKRSKLQLAVVSGSAVINLILNYLLVPRFGMYGAAYATVISMVVLTIMHYQFSKQCYFIEIFWGKLLVWIGLAVLIVLTAQYTIEGSPYSLPLKLVFVLLLSGGLLKYKHILRSIQELRN
ncbi:MAG: oligosaccharide flippase family protein [Sideroxyarcus sp.]|nr:oligosaccharide flippase family protein [Sideroxyarcus sp.]